MRLGKDLIDKPVYTLDEGKYLGRIQDLYLDDSLEAVLGLFMGAQGLVRRRSQLIRNEDITLYGSDAVLVRSAEVVTDDTEFAAVKNWQRRDKLIGRDVDTPGGTRLGVLGDVLVDATGRVTGFALGRVFVEGPVAEKRIIDRSAVLDTGSVDGRMTVDLSRLESALIDTPALPPAEDIPILVEPKE